MLYRKPGGEALKHALSVVLSSLDEIGAEQGSASADVVFQNYLADSRVRKLRRKYMFGQLATPLKRKASNTTA